MSSIFTALKVAKVQVAKVEEAEQCNLMANLVTYPATAERYSQRGASIGKSLAEEPDPEEELDNFHYEHPDYTNVESLQPTSGRKKWMMRHGKALRKKMKPDKTGYQGS